MTEAAKILKLIENVDPEDTDTLDEIDCLVTEFIDQRKIEFEKAERYSQRMVGFVEIDYDFGDKPIRVEVLPHTRSRDALPEWPDDLKIQEQVTILDDKALCDAAIDTGSVLLTPWKPIWCAKECLARLHTRIQVIEYKRKKDGELEAN
jgi:hypothetical protein